MLRIGIVGAAAAAAGLVPASPSASSAVMPLKITASVGVKSDRTSRIAFGAGAVWVPDDSSAVSRIDPKTNKVTARVTTRGHPGQAAFGAGAVWVTTTSPDTAARIDPRTKRATASIHVAANPESVAFGEGFVWTASGEPQPVVTQIDPGTSRVVAKFHPSASSATAAGDGAAWAVSPDAPDVVTRIDAKTKKSAEIQIGGAPIAVVTGLGAVWVLDTSGFVYRINPKTNKQVAKINVFSKLPVGSIATGAGFVWVGTGRGVVKIDPSTNQRVATSPVGKHPAAQPDGIASIAVGGGAVWALDVDDSKLYKIAL